MAAEREHYMCTDLAWDPTGRYVTTWVCNWKCKSENGYKIWPFHGRGELVSVTKDPFFQFLWRPTPASLLSPAQKAEVEKNLKEFQKKIFLIDKSKEAERAVEQEKEKNGIRSAFRQILGKKKRDWEEDVEWRHCVGIQPSKEDDFYIVEEWVQEVVHESQPLVVDQRPNLQQDG